MIGRPQRLADYVGQERVKGLITAELSKRHMPRHILLFGQPGLGKTSLANVIAREADLILHGWQASRDLTPKKLALALMELSTGGYSASGVPSPGADRHLVFLDEIHTLPSFEMLYPVLEDRTLNPDPFGGVSWLPETCYVVATTDPNLLPKPFQDRFPLKFRLDPYSSDEIGEMVRAKFPDLTWDEITGIAQRARGNARDACNYGESVLLHGLQYFELMEIDDQGLTALDRQVLDVLRRAGRPLSLATLAAMVRENPTTIRDVVEPALLTLGLIEITPRGRQAAGISDAPQSRGLPDLYAR